MYAKRWHGWQDVTGPHVVRTEVDYRTRADGPRARLIVRIPEWEWASPIAQRYLDLDAAKRGHVEVPLVHLVQSFDDPTPVARLRECADVSISGSAAVFSDSHARNAETLRTMMRRHGTPALLDEVMHALRFPPGVAIIARWRWHRTPEWERRAGEISERHGRISRELAEEYFAMPMRAPLTADEGIEWRGWYHGD